MMDYAIITTKTEGTPPPQKAQGGDTKIQFIYLAALAQPMEQLVASLALMTQQMATLKAHLTDFDGNSEGCLTGSDGNAEGSLLG
jgi:hypothetical protein